ncbi:MAG: DUF1565 domain-containing protein [Mastigocoleus sp.]
MKYPRCFPNPRKTDILQINKKSSAEDLTQDLAFKNQDRTHHLSSLHKSTAMKTSQINLNDQDNKYPRKVTSLGKISVPCSSLLYLSASIGITSAACITTSVKSAVAQTPKAPTFAQVDVRSISQVNVLFVNPGAGDDASDGTESTPLRTITKAVQIAKENTVIKLAQGNYSSESGEEFPIFLKPGVSIEGNTRDKGTGVIISGGGDFLSRAFGSKNVTMVGADNIEISGVTITNTNPRGYGLWVESSSPNITRNSFINSTQDGIIVTGQGSPKISQNNFYRNQANGITIMGNSRAELRENTFQYTGYAVNIGQNAEPNLINNQIKFNRSGIVVQANARPILRGNIIENSREDGLVIISKAQPDLGNSSEAGNNQFRGNRRFDINAEAAKELTTSYGNILKSDRLAGRVDVASVSATAITAQSRNQSRNQSRKLIDSQIPKRVYRPRENNISNSSTIQQAPPIAPKTESSSKIGEEIIFSAPLREFGANNTQIQPVPSQRANIQPNIQPSNRNANFPIPSTLTGNNLRPAAPRTRTPITIPQAPQTRNSEDVKQFNYINIDPNTIEFSAPPTPQSNQNSSESLPPESPSTDSNILSVPASPIPPNGNSDRQQIFPPGDETPFNPIARASSNRALRYRVMVEVMNTRDENLVKFLAPGSFLTNNQGRTVMQAGVFSSRKNAKELMRIFNNNGLRSKLEKL